MVVFVWLEGGCAIAAGDDFGKKALDALAVAECDILAPGRSLE